MTMIRDIVETFGDTQENQSVEENNKGEHSSGSSGGQSVLLLYEAQLSAAMRSAFEDKGGDDDDGDVMATVLKDKEDLLDNIPLALHASAPMAAMLSTGISQDTVVARRTNFHRHQHWIPGNSHLFFPSRRQYQSNTTTTYTVLQQILPLFQQHHVHG